LIDGFQASLKDFDLTPSISLDLRGCPNFTIGVSLHLGAGNCGDFTIASWKGVMDRIRSFAWWQWSMGAQYELRASTDPCEFLLDDDGLASCSVWLRLSEKGLIVLALN
jgi:hypothetical protein